MTQLDIHDTTISPADTDPFQRVMDALEANFGTAPTRRAAHAKGVVAVGTFTPTPAARTISRAGHLAGDRVPVITRFSNFPGGSPHPDAAPESNPRGLAVQFRLPDGSSTDLLAHSINGFPGRTVDDFSDFLEAIAPGGPGPEGYLADHPAAAKFVGAIQTHGIPASYATLPYYVVNAFRFHNSGGTTRVGRYTWVPGAGTELLGADGVASAGPDFLAEELADRLAGDSVVFSLMLVLAQDGDRSDDANDQWPADRQQVKLGSLRLTDVVPHSLVAEQGLFFDPMRLVDGITASDDPLLVARSRTYPLSLAHRHSDD
jgi:catalase